MICPIVDKHQGLRDVRSTGSGWGPVFPAALTLHEINIKVSINQVILPLVRELRASECCPIHSRSPSCGTCPLVAQRHEVYLSEAKPGILDTGIRCHTGHVARLHMQVDDPVGQAVNHIIEALQPANSYARRHVYTLITWLRHFSTYPMFTHDVFSLSYTMPHAIIDSQRKLFRVTANSLVLEQSLSC